MTTQETVQEMKLFDMFDVSDIEIKDPALVPYINVEPRVLVKSQGRNVGKFGKAEVNILERLANRIATPGHVGKRHKIITSWASGKYNKNMTTVIEVMKLIEQKTKKNPIQVFVTAIENGSPRDEITVIEHGGARYPQAIDASPTRRVDLALRWMVQGAYQRCFGKKKKMVQSLAEEIMKAADKNMESYAMSKKNEAEKQADSAR
ncbi:MAG: 30S ribosomal protein S7 [Nanoarchaeota archaeon]